MHRKLRPKIKISCRQPSSYACHSLEGRRLHTSQTKSVLPHDATKYTEVYFRKKYQNTQNNAPKRYAHTVGNRCDSAKCCVAAVYTYKYNINTILSRAIQQRYSQFEGLGKKAGSRDRTAGLTSRTRLVRSTLPASNLTQIHYTSIVVRRSTYRANGIPHVTKLCGTESYWRCDCRNVGRSCHRSYCIWIIYVGPGFPEIQARPHSRPKRIPRSYPSLENTPFPGFWTKKTPLWFKKPQMLILSILNCECHCSVILDEKNTPMI